MKSIYFCIGDLFNAVCGYRGYYTDQAMIHFDNNRLHSESKIMNRKKRKEASRVVPQNDDNGETSDGDEQTSDGDEKTTDADETTTDKEDESSDGDKQTSDDDEIVTSEEGETSDSGEDTSDDDDETTTEDVKSSVDTSDDDYGYYNPKDKRRWKEQEKF